MILPDTNLLVYAYNRRAREHEAAGKWLEAQFSGHQPIALTWPVLNGFLRVTTSARVLEEPISIQQGTEVVNQWLSWPGARIIRPGERHWTILQDLLLGVNLGGNLVMDAHLAALAIEHDCELCSADTDFARFPGLRWSNPLAR